MSEEPNTEIWDHGLTLQPGNFGRKIDFEGKIYFVGKTKGDKLKVTLHCYIALGCLGSI